MKRGPASTSYSDPPPAVMLALRILATILSCRKKRGRDQVSGGRVGSNNRRAVSEPSEDRDAVLDACDDDDDAEDVCAFRWEDFDAFVHHHHNNKDTTTLDMNIITSVKRLLLSLTVEDPNFYLLPRAHPLLQRMDIIDRIVHPLESDAWELQQDGLGINANHHDNEECDDGGESGSVLHQQCVAVNFAVVLKRRRVASPPPTRLLHYHRREDDDDDDDEVMHIDQQLSHEAFLLLFDPVRDASLLPLPLQTVTSVKCITRILLYTPTKRGLRHQTHSLPSHSAASMSHNVVNADDDDTGRRSPAVTVEVDDQESDDLATPPLSSASASATPARRSTARVFLLNPGLFYMFLHRLLSRVATVPTWLLPVVGRGGVHQSENDTIARCSRGESVEAQPPPQQQLLVLTRRRIVALFRRLCVRHKRPLQGFIGLFPWVFDGPGGSPRRITADKDKTSRTVEPANVALTSPPCVTVDDAPMPITTRLPPQQQPDRVNNVMDETTSSNLNVLQRDVQLMKQHAICLLELAYSIERRLLLHSSAQQ